jgi:endonuclease IV
MPNDSMVAFNSHRTRHESLGSGMAGAIEVFKCIITTTFANMLLVLETQTRIFGAVKFSH